MTTLSIFTCVIGEPQELQNTADSIKPLLSDKLNWILKFSDKSEQKFVRSFEGAYVHTHQQPDTSLYDALNQCLALCQSDYYMVLGAGDIALPDGMHAIQRRLDNGLENNTAFHAPLLLKATGGIFEPHPEALKYSMCCPHPSSLLKVKNSLSIGGFDISYKIASDYDHLSRYAKTFGDGRVLKIPPPVSYLGGGISDTRALEGYMEGLLIRQRVWRTPDIRIFADILKYSSMTISDTIAQSYS